MIMPATPELDRMATVKEDSQKIGAFLEWYKALSHRTKRLSIEQILAKYFDIDLDKCETERRSILAALRSKQ